MGYEEKKSTFLPISGILSRNKQNSGLRPSFPPPSLPGNFPVPEPLCSEQTASCSHRGSCPLPSHPRGNPSSCFPVFHQLHPYSNPSTVRCSHTARSLYRPPAPPFLPVSRFIPNALANVLTHSYSTIRLPSFADCLAASKILTTTRLFSREERSFAGWISPLRTAAR